MVVLNGGGESNAEYLGTRWAERRRDRNIDTFSSFEVE